jgi:hypothetical protein
LKFFENYQGGTTSEAMVIRLIEMYGLDFRPTQEDLIELRKASASDALVRAIEAARKPPPPRPIAADGHLAVVCEPVDCDVWLNGDPAGTTNHGLLPWITRAQGPVTVTATHEGYEPVQARQEAQILSDQIVRVEFLFKPSRGALTTFGASLFRQMLESLGDDGTQPRTFRATGTLYLQDAGDHRTAWSLVEWLQLADLSTFQVSRLHEKYQITLTQPGLQWKKPPKTEGAKELEPLLQLLLDNRLTRLLESFRGPGCTVVAVDPASGREGPTAFRVEGSPRTYTVTLDSAHRPSEIRVETSGPGTGLTVLYSDYTEQGGISYPKTTQILLPNGITGVEARFDTFQLAPEIRVRKARFRH